MAQVLMVVAPERFRDEELFDTQAELAQAGPQPRPGAEEARTDDQPPY